MKCPNDSELDEVVSARVTAVGDVLWLKDTSWFTSLRRDPCISKENYCLTRLTHPHELASRTQSMAQHINPAHYFGKKLHVDQNEKVNMYGVIHIVAVDGYSQDCGICNTSKYKIQFLYKKHYLSHCFSQMECGINFVLIVGQNFL